jgi:hypothetical protein
MSMTRHARGINFYIILLCRPLGQSKWRYIRPGSGADGMAGQLGKVNGRLTAGGKERLLRLQQPDLARVGEGHLCNAWNWV